MAEDSKNIEEIIASLETKFNGDEDHDIEVVRSFIRGLDQNAESVVIIKELGKYCADKFPNSKPVLDAKKIEEAIVAFQNKLNEAQGFFKEGKLEEAVQKFDELIGENLPEESPDKHQYGFSHPFEEMLCRANRGEDTKSIERISSLPVLLYYQKGAALFGLKKYDEARAEFENCLKLNPVHTRAYFELVQVAKVQEDIAQARKLLEKVYPFIFTRHDMARLYREYAYLAIKEEKFDLAVALVYISLDYEDTPQARAQLNSLAKHRGVNLSKPKVPEVQKRLGDAKIPIGPCPSVYELAIHIGKTMRKPYPEIAKMAFGIAYDLTHYEPLLKEL